MKYDEFIEDPKTIDAVVRNFEIIGEATNQLPDDVKLQNQNIDWHRIRGMRNRLIHQYFGIDYEIIWGVITNYLPHLADNLKLIKHKLE